MVNETDTDWSLYRGALLPLEQIVSSGILYRTGFNCKNLIIANCKFF